MRTWFTLLAAALFSPVLLAQVTPPGPTAGLEIVTIVHEPSASDVGPNISNIQVPNPHYDPLQPNGEPEFMTAYGNGKGLADELDSISNEFYALAGTTTHDLAIILNTTGADIVVDSSTIQLAASRPAEDVPNAPEQSSPDGTAVSTVLAYSATSLTNPGVSVTLPDGSAVALFLVNTKWRTTLDTSPRDYIWTFTFNDTGGAQFVVEGPLTVPKVGGSNPTGCASSETGYPTGVWLLATGGLVAIVTRRKLLKKARA
jgi:MYXO-CTERM domain-containing protein